MTTGKPMGRYLSALAATNAELDKLAGLAVSGAELDILSGATLTTIQLNKLAEAGFTTSTTNPGVSAASAVNEFGNGFAKVTVLTATALALPNIASGADLAVGDLIYTFPAGAIILEAVYVNLTLDPAGTENDAVVADLGVGSTLATGAVALLAGTPGFEDMMTGFGVTADGALAGITAQQSAVGGPMFIAAGDDHTVHVNVAAAWAVSASQVTTYSGTIALVWKFME